VTPILKLLNRLQNVISFYVQSFSTYIGIMQWHSLAKQSKQHCLQSPALPTAG
jgi:hypothetical protein